MSVHLEHWIAKYQADHPDAWPKRNDSSLPDDDPANAVGTESWFIGGQQTVVGKIMYDAVIAEVQRVEKGIDDALPDGTSICALPPYHKEGTASCTPHTHVRLQEYVGLDNSICGIIMLHIIPAKAIVFGRLRSHHPRQTC